MNKWANSVYSTTNDFSYLHVMNEAESGAKSKAE